MNVGTIRTYLRHNESALPSLYRNFRSIFNSDNDLTEREFLLEYFGEETVGAEIGVHRGVFSNFILEKVNPQKLYLIDPWKWFDSAQYSETLYGGRKGGGQKNMNLRFNKVEKKIRQRVISKQVTILRKLSEDAAKAIEDNSLDWVYIDGDHSYKGIMNDLVNYYNKVKIGGYIVGDDYDEHNWYKDDVVKAVRDFVRDNKVDEVKYHNRQFVLKKVS